MKTPRCGPQLRETQVYLSSRAPRNQSRLKNKSIISQGRHAEPPARSSHMELIDDACVKRIKRTQILAKAARSISIRQTLVFHASADKTAADQSISLMRRCAQEPASGTPALRSPS